MAVSPSFLSVYMGHRCSLDSPVVLGVVVLNVRDLINRTRGCAG